MLRLATKIAVAAFVILDLVLVYRLTSTHDPAPIIGGPGDGGASTAAPATAGELRDGLQDLGMTKVSDLTLFGRDAPPDKRHSTKQTGGETSSETSTSGDFTTVTGSSSTGSGSGDSTTGSGSGGSDGSSSGSTGGGAGGGGTTGGGSGGGTGDGGGGGGGGP